MKKIAIVGSKQVQGIGDWSASGESRFRHKLPDAESVYAGFLPAMRRDCHSVSRPDFLIHEAPFIWTILGR